MKKKSTEPYGKRAQPVFRLLSIAAFLACMTTAAPSFSAPASSTVSNTAALNFVGADIDSVIKAVGHYTNITFIIDPRVKGTINLVSEKPLTKAQAFNLLTSTLRMQGYAVVMGDGYAKVVPEADAKLQPGPTIAKGSKIKGDQIATQIFRLNYESAANMVGVLRPLISPNNTINANPGTNSLVITDYADNLRRIGKIIAALDAPATSDLEVIPVQYAVATDIAVMVNKLMESGGAQAPGVVDTGRTSLFADTRTNSVIIRAPSQARSNLAKYLVSKLDQPTAQPGNIHVIYLKNADAVKLAQTLRAVVTADTSSPQTSPTPQATQTPNTTSSTTQNQGLTTQASPSSTSTTPATLSSGGAGGFIQADASTNTLIITASEPIYRNLREVVDKLDVRRAQVYIEALIVEVSAEKSAEFSIQWLGLTGNSNSSYRLGGVSAFGSQASVSSSGVISGTSNNIISLAANAITTSSSGSNTVVPGNGMSLGLFKTTADGKLGLGAILHALESDANSNVLSTPNLITLDNEEAKMMVGQNVPFVTGSYTTSSSGSSNPFQTVERKDVGISLRVRPQISEGGTVRMAIYQEISSIDSSTTSNSNGATTNKRSIETNVLTDDGQIIVLGGLIQDTVSDSSDKVPGLGDIPILGNLFKSKSRTRTKTNLMVFLRPTVIRNSPQSENVLADRYDYIRNMEIMTQPGPSFGLPDTGAPILPQLENGKPVGGILVKPPSLAAILDSTSGAKAQPSDTKTPQVDTKAPSPSAAPETQPEPSTTQ